MKYYFKSKEEFKGDLYEMNKLGKKLIKKNYNFLKEKDLKVIAGILCQQVADGESLDTICAVGDPYPSKFEFYNWVSADLEIKTWYNQAMKQRNLATVETFYKKIKHGEKIGSEEAGKVLEILKKIGHELKLESDDGVRTIVKTQLWPMPPAIKKDYESNK